MSDYNIKQQLNRDIQSVIRILRKAYGAQECKITKFNDDIFHVEIARPNEIRRIRVTINQIQKADVELLEKIKLPEIITKEVWCRRGRDSFEIRAIN